MKRILITGVTGFVGRQVLNNIATKDIQVIVVARDIQHVFVEHYPAIERVIITSDIFSETEEWWVKTLQDIDMIIHVAWYVKPGEYLQSNQNMDCLLGTVTMAKAAVKAGVKRVVGIGTCFEYDLNCRMLATSTPLKPSSVYASAKAATYLALSQWLPLKGVEFAWCRLFYLYGEGEDCNRLAPYIRDKLIAGTPVDLTSGNQIRDFIDVKEAGIQIADISFSEVIGAVNICSGVPITIKKFAENIADEFGRRDLLRFGTRPDNLVDPLCVVGIKNN